MFTNTEARMATLNPDTIYFNAVCVSSDTKPTEGVRNGSICIEMDTSTLYFFDEASKTWRAWA